MVCFNKIESDLAHYINVTFCELWLVAKGSITFYFTQFSSI